MKFNAVAFTVFVLTLSGICKAQNAVDQLQPLIEMSAHRLAIADQVSLAKADSGAAVEDIARENVVIENAVKEGTAKGLEKDVVSNFFKAQIEANKIVQYSLLSNWRRTGQVPEHAKINLAQTIRPELDQLQTGLITELANTSAIRSAPTCRVDLAKAIGKYLSSHPSSNDALHAIALDRSLGAACAP